MTTKFQDYSKPEDQDFRRVQIEMCRNWQEDLRRRGVDLEAHSAQRRAAYDRRWREALNHTAPGSCILDIGGGYLHDSLLRLITSQGHDYHESDIDPAAIAYSRDLGSRYQIPPDHFVAGENTQLPHPDHSFDLVFSSHCLEHSRDIQRTLAEIRRVLRPAGKLFFAVPVGWDAAIEHIYFLDADDWIALVESSGFKVHGTLVGDFYPESGFDLAVIATPDGGAATSFSIDSFRKSSYTLRPWSDRSIHLVGDWDRRGDCAVAMSTHARLLWEGTAGEAHLLVACNRWSGVAELSSSAGERYAADLYSWYPHQRVIRCLPFHAASPQDGRAGLPLEEVLRGLRHPRSAVRGLLASLRAQHLQRSRWFAMAPLGHGAAAHAAQLAVHGLLTRDA